MKITKSKLVGDGDFRSPECVEIMEEADIVVTNPPFSLFREYVAQLVAHKKKFLIIGPMNAITYKEIFPLIKNNLLWLGYNNGAKKYFVPDTFEGKSVVVIDGERYMSMGNTIWFTNLKHKKRYEDLLLYRKYNPKEYPTYDNYNAIEVSKTKDIPC
ncbi:MAG: adenine-specific methyltransferase EcoRI family protein, partial [Gracilimonas sp.]